MQAPYAWVIKRNRQLLGRALSLPFAGNSAGSLDCRLISLAFVRSSSNTNSLFSVAEEVLCNQQCFLDMIFYRGDKFEALTARLGDGVGVATSAGV